MARFAGSFMILHAAPLRTLHQHTRINIATCLTLAPPFSLLSRFYNPSDIVRQFGAICGYEAPRDTHPSSIMSLSNTGGHGRGGQEGRVIGDVICHGKRAVWGQKNAHYHQGMHAGENTLNAQCARCGDALCMLVQHWAWCHCNC